MNENDFPKTVGDIARELGVPQHRVKYVIESRHIEHCGTAGTIRLFDAATVQQIKGEMRRIGSCRSGVMSVGKINSWGKTSTIDMGNSHDC